MYHKENKNKRYFTGTDTLSKNIMGALVFPDTYREQAENKFENKENMKLRNVEVNLIREILTTQPIKYSKLMKL